MVSNILIQFPTIFNDFIQFHTYGFLRFIEFIKRKNCKKT